MSTSHSWSYVQKLIYNFGGRNSTLLSPEQNRLSTYWESYSVTLFMKIPLFSFSVFFIASNRLFIQALSAVVCKRVIIWGCSLIPVIVFRECFVFDVVSLFQYNHYIVFRSTTQRVGLFPYICQCIVLWYTENVLNSYVFFRDTVL